MNFMDKYLYRLAEKQILRDLQQFPVVGIVGPRQVGKTTLAKMLMSKLEKKVYYLDLELQEDITKLENAEFYFNNHREDCIILDEIQNLPELFPVIRGMIDQHRIPGRLCY